MRAGLRQIILTVCGLAALIYAIWPPSLEFEYLGLAGILLGIEPLAQGYSSAPHLREPNEADQRAFAHWLDGREKRRDDQA